MAISIIEDPQLWDRFVEDSPDGLLFHKWDFLEIMERHTGCELLTYGVYKGAELIALFPVFYRKDLAIRSVFSPPPQTCVPYMGFVMSAGFHELKDRMKEGYLRTVVDEVSAKVKKLSPNYVYFKLPPAYRDIRPFRWNGYREESNFTYIIDLGRSAEELLRDIDKKAKVNIRKAEERSLRLEPASDVEAFCRIMQKRYEEQGMTLPIASPQYLKDLLEAYPGHIKMYFLYDGDQVVSMITNYEYKRRVIDWIGAPKLDGEVEGNDYLKWALIRKAKADGYAEYEIQGAGNQRLSRFKAKYNPRLEVCYAITRKDAFGTLAEWGYNNVIKRKWL